MEKLQERDNKLLYIIKSTADELKIRSWTDCEAVYNRFATSPTTQDRLSAFHELCDKNTMEIETRTAEWIGMRECVREWLLYAGRISRHSPAQSLEIATMTSLRSETDLTIDTSFEARQTQLTESFSEAADTFLPMTNRANEHANIPTNTFDNALLGMSNNAGTGATDNMAAEFSTDAFHNISTNKTISGLDSPTLGTQSITAMSWLDSNAMDSSFNFSTRHVLNLPGLCSRSCQYAR